MFKANQYDYYIFQLLPEFPFVGILAKKEGFGDIDEEIRKEKKIYH